ncbi:MAG: iron-containing alcohol dehydrogenase [Pseudomonadota bacterium]
MTLITYRTRVHFADGVLEEALRSEMELNGKRRPLIIAEEPHITGDMSDRFLSSFPIRVRAECFSAVPHRASETAARSIAELYRQSGCDLLIAYGSNRAMDLAKVARVAIAYDEPIEALSTEEGGAQRITDLLPDLYSVPSILGFASAITDYTRVKVDHGGQVLLSSRHLIPTVAICDPTLTIGASPEQSACAAAGILARSVDGYLSPSYNPPADGMALDALRRVVDNVQRVVQDDDLKARREMMASGLNSSLALHNGPRAVHAICNAVAAVSSNPIDPSALGGVLIPQLARTYEQAGVNRVAELRNSLSLARGEELSDGLTRIVASLPLAQSLSDLGVSGTSLARAADLAARDRAIANAPLHLSARRIRAMLEAAHGQLEAKKTANA